MNITTDRTELYANTLLSGEVLHTEAFPTFLTNYPTNELISLNATFFVGANIFERNATLPKLRLITDNRNMASMT